MQEREAKKQLDMGTGRDSVLWCQCQYRNLMQSKVRTAFKESFAKPQHSNKTRAYKVSSLERNAEKQLDMGTVRESVLWWWGSLGTYLLLFNLASIRTPGPKPTYSVYLHT